MAKNKALGEVVLGQMADFLNNNDQSFKMMTDGERELGASIIENMGELVIDEPHKVRMHFSIFIGYGYDFTKDDEGTPAREIYDRAVRNTRELGGRPHLEKLAAEGVVDDRYGWYITRLG